MSEKTMTSDSTESGSDLTISEATTAFEGMLSTPEDSKEQPTEKEEDTQEAEVEEITKKFGKWQEKSLALLFAVLLPAIVLLSFLAFL